MKTISTLRNATIWIACLGFLTPTVIFGAQPTVTAPQAQVVQDVAMGATNTLTGQLVNAQGQRLANAPVVIQSKTQETLRTVTDSEGRFQATNLRGGVYHVAAGSARGMYRLLSEAVAPPAATKGLLLVDSQATVRGQCASGACGGGGYADYGTPVSYGGDGCGDACGAPVAYDACGSGCGAGACGAGGCGGGGGLLGLLSNPWVIGAGVAAAIAIPLALDDDDAS